MNHLKSLKSSSKIQKIDPDPRFQQPKSGNNDQSAKCLILSWVMQFDTFLTHEECHALEHTVGPFERSTDTGAKNEHGEAGRVLSKGRNK